VLSSLGLIDGFPISLIAEARCFHCRLAGKFVFTGFRIEGDCLMPMASAMAYRILVDTM
jgi:hypothetical protein